MICVCALKSNEALKWKFDKISISINHIDKITILKELAAMPGQQTVRLFKIFVFQRLLKPGTWHFPQFTSFKEGLN